jgi:hypothetical protein
MAAKSSGPTVDWERIEVDHRIGAKSLREIAAEHGISHVAIQKRAKKLGWTRDLSAKVKARADALVTKAAVTTQVNNEAKVTEQVAVEVEATMQARIRLAHRSDIGKGKGLAMKLLAELEHQTGNQDLYEQLADLMLDPPSDEDSAAAQTRYRKQREAFDRALGLGGRQDTLKKWAETMRILIDKEREAFGMTGAPPPSTYEQTLREAIEEARAGL